jgi:acyl dehydratase
MSLKWVKPVLPGDTIRAVFEVIETREFKSRPGLGSLTMTHLAINQRDETVIDCTCTHIIRKRPADPDNPGKLG